MTGATGALFWLVLAVVLFVIESVTVQMVCIWFAFGALAGMLASFIGAPVLLQLMIFLVTSIAVLIAGRPIVMNRLATRREATNADRVVGQLGIVIEQIDNIAQTGRVSANGLDWSARCEYDVIVPKGSKVLVKHIEGVKLIVQPLPPDYQNPSAYAPGPKP